MKISIVVPTYNESAFIIKTIDSIASQIIHKDIEIELLIADGGSTDNTTELITSYFDSNTTLPVRLFLSEKGRAKQMNCGAYFATGDVILFLHADTTLSSNALQELARAVENPVVRYGYFFMKFDSDHPLGSFYSSATKLNSLLTHFGDSGIFIKPDFFNELGKFAEEDFLEDVDFLLRARAKSEPFLISSACVVSSARRFEKNGYIYQMLSNISIVSLFMLGVKASWLKQFYQENPKP